MNTTKQTTGMKNGLQMRMTDADRSIIRSTFRGNGQLMTVLRKIFLPELDPTVDIGQMIDLWLTLENVNKGATPEQKLINLEARNLLIQHLDQSLMQLEIIANQPEEGAKAVVSSNK